MQKLLLISQLLILLSFNALFAQEEGETSIKIYTNARFTLTTLSRYEPVEDGIIFLEDIRKVDIGYFSPALSISRSNNTFHEIEFSRAMINQTFKYYSVWDSISKKATVVNGSKRTVSMVALRYEYMTRLFKKGEGNLKTFFGYSLHPYYLSAQDNPGASTHFPEKHREAGVDVALVPRLTYEISERLYLDLNIPFVIVNGVFISKKIDDPALPDKLRTTSYFTFDSFTGDQMHFRLGMGLRI